MRFWWGFVANYEKENNYTQEVSSALHQYFWTRSKRKKLPGGNHSPVPLTLTATPTLSPLPQGQVVFLKFFLVAKMTAKDDPTISCKACNHLVAETGIVAGWKKSLGGGPLQQTRVKGIVSDSNNIILWHEWEDINKESVFPKFQLILILRFQVMHDYVWFIAPIDYSVE